MDFKDTFDSLKDKATDLAQAGVAQSKRLAEIAKLKTANMAEEDAIKKAYMVVTSLNYGLPFGVSILSDFPSGCKGIQLYLIIFSSHLQLCFICPQKSPLVQGA